MSQPATPSTTAAEAPVESPAAPDAPMPVLAGTFALYDTPDGGYVLVTDIPGRGVEHRTFAGKLVRLMTGRMGRLFGAGEVY